MEQNQEIANLVANMHNLEISVMAINTRLSLIEAFNSQLAQGQIDTKSVLTQLMKASQQPQEQTELRQTVFELIKTVNQMKATQNMLMIRSKDFQSK